MSEHPNPAAERWSLIKQIFHAALEKPEEERASFLKAACGADSGMLSEVQSLLDQAGATGSLLEGPPLVRAARLEEENRVAAAAEGRTIGPYRIVKSLGAGGMGKVYRAHDPRMGRDVAIKVTSESFSERFSGEVRAVAALNHPNICHIYDAGPDYLVMELCEGETLAARLKQRGKLPVSEAIEYGIQIANALSAAHAKGIVHRDLKPANIMLTQDGIKLLDFGLAKRLDEQPAGGDPSPLSTTIESRFRTETGAIIGTAAYMSPEQAEGKPVDARTDVFSFGAVLYEMITGERAFQGESNLSTLSAVLNKEPAPLDAGVPNDLRKLITRCLRKSAAARLQHMGDIKVLLEELRSDAKEDAAAGAGRRHWGWLALAALPVLALGGWGGSYVFSKFAVSKPETPATVVHLTSYPGIENSPSFSPDGTQVAFTWTGEEKQGNSDIYVRLVSGGPPLRLTKDPEPAYSPAWSPDGSQIAFLRKGFLYLISPLGGPERKLTPALGSPSWSPDGKFLAFADAERAEAPRSIYMVSVETGERRRLTSPRNGVWGGDQYCAYSPDGGSLAFARHMNGTADIYILPLANSIPNGEARLLTTEKVNFAALAWMPDGRELVYSSNRGGRTALWRLSLSPGAKPQRVLGTEEGGLFSISRGPTTPRLAFVRLDIRWNIWQGDLAAASGTFASPPRPLIVSTRIQSDPQFSPDGTRIAFASDRSDSRELWVADGTGANPVQLTHFGGARSAGAPRWSPDGSQIAFDSTDGTAWDIYVINSGGGAPRRLTDGSASFVRPSWSQDGRWIYFGSTPAGSMPQIWKMPAEGGGNQAAVQVTQNGGLEGFESLDGKTFYFAKGYDSPGIWSIATHGGPETSLIPAVRPGYWAVAENGILFLDFAARVAGGPVPLKFYKFATGQTAQFGTLDKVTPVKLNTLSVSRDGLRAIWCQMDSAESDLMLVENFR